jgi:prepilin-type N-terminal cleavage/methylation domain-containing protein
MDHIRGQRGFTLLELILVLTLVVMVLGFSSFIVLGTTLSSARLSSTARDLSATIREARLLARVNGDQQIVSIDLDTGKYGIEGRKTRIVPRDTGILIRDPFAGEILRGQYRMVFNASRGTDSGTVVLWSGKKTLVIQTDPIVGSVVIKS